MRLVLLTGFYLNKNTPMVFCCFMLCLLLFHVGFKYGDAIKNIPALVRKAVCFMNFGAWVLRDQMESNHLNSNFRYQLGPRDPLITQMEVTKITPEKVTNKTSKFGSLGRTWYGNIFHG